MERKVDYQNWQTQYWPLCLANSDETYVGRKALIQGYGLTESGMCKMLMNYMCKKLMMVEILFHILGYTSKDLLETIIKVITNQDCSNLKDYKFLSAYDLSRQKIRNSLPKGIPDEMLCAEGLSLNASGAFTVSPN